MLTVYSSTTMWDRLTIEPIWQGHNLEQLRKEKLPNDSIFTIAAISLRLQYYSYAKVLSAGKLYTIVSTP